jgi:hypothetical protein
MHICVSAHLCLCVSVPRPGPLRTRAARGPGRRARSSTGLPGLAVQRSGPCVCPGQHRTGGRTGRGPGDRSPARPGPGPGPATRSARARSWRPGEPRSRPRSTRPAGQLGHGPQSRAPGRAAIGPASSLERGQLEHRGRPVALEVAQGCPKVAPPGCPYNRRSEYRLPWLPSQKTSIQGRAGCPPSGEGIGRALELGRRGPGRRSPGRPARARSGTAIPPVMLCLSGNHSPGNPGRLTRTILRVIGVN